MTVTLQLTEAGDEATLADLRAVLRDAERCDGASAFSDQAMLAAVQGTRALYAIRRDVTGAAAPGAASRNVAGYALVGAGELDLVVHPDLRSHGTATAALQQILATTDEPELLAWTHGAHAAPHALLSHAGFVGVRTLYRMELPADQLGDAVLSARPVPESVRLESYVADSAELAEGWVRINAAAFADHPEQGAVTLSDFLALTREPWFDAADLRFARSVETNELLGFSWVKTVREPAAATVETELYVLGVLPAAAGTGLGAALFGVALARMTEHAPSQVSLYVDASNTRAVQLYERAGFHIATRSTQWQRSASVR